MVTMKHKKIIMRNFVLYVLANTLSYYLIVYLFDKVTGFFIVGMLFSLGLLIVFTYQDIAQRRAKHERIIHKG